MTLTTDHDALLAAIIAAPEDDAPRLIYADWLDENGQEDRAEFIRLQISLKDIPQQEIKRYAQDCTCQTCQKINRIRQLNDSVRDQLKMKPHIFMTCEHGYDWTLWGSTPTCPQVVRRRGFVDEIRCKLSEWMTHGPKIVRQHPITKVVLTDFRHWSDEDGIFKVWSASLFLNPECPGDGEIPGEIFRRLKTVSRPDVRWLNYVDENNLLADLSQACVTWAKSAPN